eukprot:s483_g15.t1
MFDMSSTGLLAQVHFLRVSSQILFSGFASCIFGGFLADSPRGEIAPHRPKADVELLRRERIAFETAEDLLRNAVGMQTTESRLADLVQSKEEAIEVPGSALVSFRNIPAAAESLAKDWVTWKSSRRLRRSSFVKVTGRIETHLHPYYLSRLGLGLRGAAGFLLHRWSESLRCIPLGFVELRPASSYAAVVAESPYVHFLMHFVAVGFAPRKGDWVVGRVSETQTRVGLNVTLLGLMNCLVRKWDLSTDLRFCPSTSRWLDVRSAEDDADGSVNGVDLTLSRMATPVVEKVAKDEPVSSWWGICRLAACITNIGMIIGMYSEYLWAADWPELPQQCEYRSTLPWLDLADCFHRYTFSHAMLRGQNLTIFALIGALVSTCLTMVEHQRVRRLSVLLEGRLRGDRTPDENQLAAVHRSLQCLSIYSRLMDVAFPGVLLLVPFNLERTLAAFVCLPRAMRCSCPFSGPCASISGLCVKNGGRPLLAQRVDAFQIMACMMPGGTSAGRCP